MEIMGILIEKLYLMMTLFNMVGVLRKFMARLNQLVFDFLNTVSQGIENVIDKAERNT